LDNLSKNHQLTAGFTHATTNVTLTGKLCLKLALVQFLQDNPTLEKNTPTAFQGLITPDTTIYKQNQSNWRDGNRLQQQSDQFVVMLALQNLLAGGDPLAYKNFKNEVLALDESEKYGDNYPKTIVDYKPPMVTIRQAPPAESTN
jgi:hypothetical protein